ncbi:probable methyltransferase-like protein 15 [Centruroides sculpturatus]|uniref:probable methyltransferase-like protein 15 n=1 Tax=Centruroides sculpturatus TaxID=218467 RepID=UPI000C6E2D67|nr:probable methyltransferase-like protein 15 [Centruroides sculpturatus]XP_023219922.1 probable methyltransferase-like protein 15 [Centruroides sculpturatus]
MQFSNPQRGFALSANGPLDMRMDGERFPNQPTASDVVNNLDFPSLVKIFKIYGEERYAKKIAQVLIDARFMMKKIRTTQELADIVSVVVTEPRLDKLERKAHSATKVFQALRIFVNNELNELNYGMEMAYQYLKRGGRVVTLTFHSLEDRIIKRHLMDIDINEPVSSSLSQKYKNASLWHSEENMKDIMSKRWCPINKKVITPTEEEIELNPRSRSAKLRAAMKI